MSISRFSTRQLAVLQGIVDGLLPSMEPPTTIATNDDDEHKNNDYINYYRHSLSSNADFIQALETSIFDKVAAQESLLIRILLWIVSTTIGTMLIFGTLQPLWTLNFSSFAECSTADQSTMLRSLQCSAFQERRKIFNGFKRLICGLAYSFVVPNKRPNTDDSSNGGQLHLNPFWPAIGYQGPPQHYLTQQQEKELIMKHQTGGKVDYRTIDGVLLQISNNSTLLFDVVIVGSGCGGGVAAAILAKAGYSVLVLEKGPYVSPSAVSNLEVEALDQMYESHGLLTTNDGNIMMLAGSTLGGGSTINWSCCLETPDHVRQEWVQKHGLGQFGAGFDEHMAAIKTKIGCNNETQITHNKQNQHLMDACNTLGYQFVSAGLNVRNSDEDTTGFLCFGDRYGNKNDGLSTYLLDAVSNSAKIIENCTVEKVMMESSSANSPRGKRATGVLARVGKHQVTVTANKCVIVAAGSLNSPCVLLRSGLRNKHIGRHLHLHPVIPVAGLFDKDVDVNCYLKAPMTVICNEFQMGPRNDGYGPKIECPSTHIGLLAAGLSHSCPVKFKQRMLRSRHSLTYILLQRDSSEGRVTLGADGPRIDYVLNDADKESFLQTLSGAIKLLVASGVNTVVTSHSRDPSLTLEEGLSRTKESIDTNPQIRAYLDSTKARGMNTHEMGVFCAHQMGSCRMSTGPDGGVVDPSGEAWECQDLFLVDTSVFPTASGANPMLTTLAISHMLSTRLVERWRMDDKSSIREKKEH